MAQKRKTLPKNFNELIQEKDIEKLKKVFESCQIDARGGYGKTTALSFFNIPDELVFWLVENGADIEAVDYYERTALHQHSMARNGNISVFLELGANVKAKDTYGNTPLHFAAANAFNAVSVKQLIAHGAETNSLNADKQTPLKKALAHATNINLVQLVEVAEVLLAIEPEITKKMKDEVTRIGQNFEFHRDNFNRDYLEETDQALNSLYAMFNVPPIKKRMIHDGVSPIIVSNTSWQKQYEKLWEFLIPSSGSARTVQGEVIRIAGKVRDEILRNGGINWDNDFKKMLDAFLIYLQSENTISTDEFKKANVMVQKIRLSGDAETNNLNYLCELATKWVSLNPNPLKLKKTTYRR